ncbi:hypothetical protein V6K52_01855 [Knoellia sp. S7-12]|uniref:hypothetical protein n=1 Tax=Knoellia sp. S7-12 TaxID=3126698 RepID=UPI00336856EB
MSDAVDNDDPIAWVDERHLGSLVGARYGADAERFEISLVRFLAKEGFGELHRRERFRADGARIGPDLKVPLDTAALVLEIFEAARTAVLRVLARDEADLPLRYVQLEEVLSLLLEAGCEPPGSVDG